MTRSFGRSASATPLGVLAALAGACAGGGGGGRAEPAPAPVPRPPAATPAPAAASTAFVYEPGTYRYEVRADAVIERPDARGDRENVGTVAQVSYTLTRQPRGLGVTGQVESYVVSAGARVTAGAAGAGLTAPLAFRGTVDATGARLSTEGTLSQRCDGPFGAALTAAREALVRFPPSLATGTRWVDTTSALTCRGDVPATLQTIARYEVVGRANFAGTSAIHVRRQTTTTLQGSGVASGRPLTITGAGTGQSSLYVDTARGRLLGSTGESRTTLTVRIQNATQQFEQRATQRVTMQ
jgi:hypothetical protein